MKEQKRNLPASVAARLLNRARQTGDDYQTLLTSFCLERFLYRLGLSGPRARFVLKAPGRATGMKYGSTRSRTASKLRARKAVDEDVDSARRSPDPRGRQVHVEQQLHGSGSSTS